MTGFDFLGFDPSAELQKESQTRLRQLLKMATGVVGHDAYIVKTRAGVFEGSLKIHTAWDTFSVSAIHKSPELVLQGIHKKMKERIISWLRMRNPILPSSRYWLDNVDERDRYPQRKAS